MPREEILQENLQKYEKNSFINRRGYGPESE